MTDLSFGNMILISFLGLGIMALGIGMRFFIESCIRIFNSITEEVEKEFNKLTEEQKQDLTLYYMQSTILDNDYF